MRMYGRKELDISAYFVVGPENTLGRPVADMVQAVVNAGYTCIQLRSNQASAREMIELCRQSAEIIARAGKTGKTCLLVDDRLDVVLAARKQGIHVDGIHVGQSDIPVSVCREYLGEDSVVGLSARVHELFEYIRTEDVSQVDYFGAGPLHPSKTKPNCGMDMDGTILTRSLEELTRLAQCSPIPVVVGGGITLEDIPGLAQTGIDGFFVVSAIAGACDPERAARALLESWNASR